MFRIGMVTVLIFLGLGGCDSQVNSQQNDFCKIIDKYRNDYIRLDEQGSYIGKEAEMSALPSMRQSELQSLLGSGHVSGWSGIIDRVFPGNGGAGLAIELPCESTLYTNDSLFIPKGSSLYARMSDFREGQRILFSGHFITDEGGSTMYPFGFFYAETSFTKSGAMTEPEFYFKFEDFHLLN